MSGTTHPETTMRELDFRSADGIEVSLLWEPRGDRVFVSVLDTKAGDAFEVEVAPGEAQDAFRHPYAYAAARGIPYPDPRLDPAAETDEAALAGPA